MVCVCVCVCVNWTSQIVPFFSFNSDYQMVIDAQVVLTVEGPDGEPVQELLYPPRHQITLPLNNLNFIFESCEVSFNQTTKLTSDKYDNPPPFPRNGVSCVCLCVQELLPGLGRLGLHERSGTEFQSVA
jgi:hypothetical protein